MKQAVFVDLSNFYSGLLRSNIAPPRELRDYFLHWLDFDLVAAWLTGERVPVWVFYSGRRLGSKSERVEHEFLTQYADRINQLPGVTAYDVEIPGEQREPMNMICKQCNTSNAVVWESEKGVDAALIVHLFDTEEAWDHAYLFSGDADFTPAVRSLRRRGKLVSGAGFTASRALLRELHDFSDLTDTFFRADFAAYKMFGPGGLVECWLTNPVAFEPKHEGRMHVTTRVSWTDKCSTLGMDYSGGRPLLVQQSASVLFEDEGLFSLPDRELLLGEFACAFPELRWNDRHLLIKPAGWMSVKRRLPKLVRRFDGTMTDNVGVLQVSFDKTPDKSGWQLPEIQPLQG